ncbi:MAG: hypothetical protein K9L17_11505 [Clostridiales bacterium]|nr:hypothetical protein [Clostridiales bacterium]MCF8023308.1 hypothetical protein [Clostridiales bacterium]
MKIKLPITYDWTYLMGLTGLIRLISKDKFFFPNQFEVEVDTEDMKKVSENYFKLCFNYRNPITQLKEILNNEIFMEKEFNKLTRFRDDIKKNANGFSKVKEKVLEEFAEIFEKKKKIINKSGNLNCCEEDAKQITDLVKESLRKVITYLEEKEKLEKDDEISINEQFALRSIRGKYLKPIIGQSGLLNPAVKATYLNTKSHADWFKQNIVEVAIEEIQNPDSCPNRCFFIPSLPGVYKFSNNEFFQLGISEVESVNYQWNYNADSLPRISSMAKLIMLLVPLGAAQYNKEYNYSELTEKKQDIRPTWSFLVTSEPFSQMYETNIKYIKEKEREENFSIALKETINDISKRSQGTKDSIRVKAQKERQYKDEITVVEVWANPNNQEKKSAVETLTLPDYVVKFFGNEKYFSKIDRIHTKFSNRITAMIMKGIDFQPLIYELFYASLKENFYFYHKNICEAKIIINHLKKGGNPVNNKAKRDFDNIFSKAVQLKNILICYKQWDDRKLNGVIYKLLNTAKTRNRKDFLDIVFRLHINAEIEISKSLVNAQVATNESNVSFDDIANAFIGGLLTKVNCKEDKNNGKQ